MSVFEFEVYYEHQPSEATPFRLEDDDVERNLRLIPNDLEHFLQESRVTATQEDYSNQRIHIRIEAPQTEDEIVAEVKRALGLAKLFRKQL
ncbi:MAG: hypothetical protein R6V03_02395 [Kiritimatiellia bacterium]